MKVNFDDIMIFLVGIVMLIIFPINIGFGFADYLHITSYVYWLIVFLPLFLLWCFLGFIEYFILNDLDGE